MTSPRSSEARHHTPHDPIELPFDRGGRDWGGWVYEHRVGVLVTTAAYLLLAIFLVTARIVVRPTESQAFFEIDLEDVEALAEERDRLEEQVRQMQQLDALEREYYESVRNMASNEQGQLNAGVRDAQNTGAEQIYDEARALQERMDASRQRYEQGLADAEAIGATRPEAPSGSQTASTPARVAGNVSISYSLDGRTAVDLYRPTYLCRGGGDVTVRIEVDRNGRVVDAAAEAASTGDACLREYAVKAARASLFNTDGSAPARQSGTITYRFAPQ